jgi:hypothetical protein
MRTGKFTASEVWKLFVEGRKGMSETAKGYIFEKAIEEVTGFRKKFTSKEMEHGIIHERDAFEHFKQLTQQDWIHTGDTFISINDYSGASPDAILMNDLETIAVCDFKCPQPLTFFEKKKAWLDGEPVERNYFLQVQMQMMAANCEMGYLVYYLAEEFGNTYTGEVEFKFDLPLESRIFIISIEKDQEVWDKITAKIEEAQALKLEIIKTI